MDADYGPIRAWIQAMYTQGYSAEAIRAQLAQQGWSPADLDALLGASPAPAPPQPVIQPPTPGYAQAPYSPAQPAAAQTDGQALAALVLGIATLFLGPLTGIAALILGTMALKRGGPGRPLALAGVIVSASLLFFWLIFIVIFIVGAYFSAKAPGHAVQQPAPSSTPATPGPETPDNSLVAPDHPAAAPGGEDRAVCLARLKELAGGMLLYAADYDTTLPDATSWPLAVKPYVKDEQSFLCPADDRADKQDPGGRPTSFTMYEPMGGSIMRSFSQANNTWLLFDGTLVTAQEGDLGAFRHDGGLNLAYADGHAQWVSEAEFKHPQ